MRILFWLLVSSYLLIIPVTLCAIHFRHPEWFRGWRLAGWVLLTAIVSWFGVNLAIWLPYHLGLFLPRGPEVVFALFFGWAYLGIASLPVFLLYGTLRGLCTLVKTVRRPLPEK